MTFDLSNTRLDYLGVVVAAIGLFLGFLPFKGVLVITVMTIAAVCLLLARLERRVRSSGASSSTSGALTASLFLWGAAAFLSPMWLVVVVRWILP